MTTDMILHRWRTGLLAIGLIACLASAAVLIASAMSSQDADSKLTYTITRDDLLVTVVEQGIVESAENTEIKCKVRGLNTVIWVIESGTVVKSGDELFRLDSLFIQEQIDERTKYAHWSRSAAEYSKASVAAAELAVPEYEQGRYVSELMRLEKDLVIAESNLRSCQNLLSHAQLMANSDYISQLVVEEKEFAVEQARLNLALKQTEIDVLKRFTQAEELQTLQGNLAATSATHEANVERAVADASRRDRALEEIQHCIVKAERAGLVIHPDAARWETAPIAEGATVHKDQVLLLMPDLSQMQVKVGINESVIDRVKEGLPARVTLSNKTVDGTVSSVASVTKPAGWWTGNQVKYDTLIAIPSEEGLMPGMSAEVKVIIARYEDVLTIPVAAVVEADAGHFCWVKTAEGARQRSLVLGDSNGIFTVVKDGLREGDEVVLNPRALGSGGFQPPHAH
ncbi:MAG: HlyD family efflux transporter periplasmic adaptor subunit [Planctomycetota bacterium]|nr:HlyD family efflux transporter periplasmic adaptor subunit [Planctomycetota bacterium]